MNMTKVKINWFACVACAMGVLAASADDSPWGVAYVKGSDPVSLNRTSAGGICLDTGDLPSGTYEIRLSPGAFAVDHMELVDCELSIVGAEGRTTLRPSGSSVRECGGAISCIGGSVVISNLVFEGFFVKSAGGAVALQEMDGDSAVVGCRFVSCRSTDYSGTGGAVYASAASGAEGRVTLVVRDSEFVGCWASSGGALTTERAYPYREKAIALALSGCTFSENEATFCGGALWIEGDATFGQTLFNGNRAGAGGGGAVCVGSSDTDYLGAAVRCEAGVVFRENVANDLDYGWGNGGAVALASPKIVFSAERAAFLSNVSDYAGGALFAGEDAEVALSTCVFSNNTVVASGGFGGALDVELSKCAMTNITVRGSNANALDFYGTDAKIVNCVVIDNGGCDVSVSGGGLEPPPSVIAFRSAFGSLVAADGVSVTTNECLVGRSAADFDGGSLHLSGKESYNPVAAEGIVQEATDFDGIEYGSKEYGYSMGAFECPTVACLFGTSITNVYDGCGHSNDFTVGAVALSVTWEYKTSEGGEWSSTHPVFINASKSDYETWVRATFGGVTMVTNATVTITQRVARVGFEAKDKVYDGKTDAEPTKDGFEFETGVTGETLVFDVSEMTFWFDDPNVGDRTVTSPDYSPEYVTVKKGAGAKNPETDREKLRGNYDITFVDTAPAKITAGDPPPPDVPGGQGEEPDEPPPAPGEIPLSDYDWVGMYDGEGHTLRADDLWNVLTNELPRTDAAWAGVVGSVGVAYSADGSSWTDDLAAFTYADVVSTSFWYRVTADNFATNYHAVGVTVTNRPSVITFAAADKPYDGTTNATCVVTNFSNVVKGEDLSLDVSRMGFWFADPNVGKWTVTATGYADELVGAGNAKTKVSNYSFEFVPTASASITRIPPPDIDEPPEGSEFPSEAGPHYEDNGPWPTPAPTNGVGEVRDLSNYDWVGMYDGEGHTFDTNKLYDAITNGEWITSNGYQVQYSLDGTPGSWVDTPFVFTNVTATSFWYNVEVPSENLMNYSNYIHAVGVTITQRVVTVKSADDSWEYNGKPHGNDRVDVIAGSFADGEGIWTNDFPTITDVGVISNSYKYGWFKGDEANYTFSALTGELRVTAKPVGDGSGFTIGDFGPYIYDGTGHEPTPTVHDDAVGADVTTVSYTWENNTNATDAAVLIITFTGNYSGAITNTFPIGKREVTIKSDDGSWVYDGEEHGTNRVTVTADSKYPFVAGEGVMPVSFATITDVGTKPNTYELTWPEGTLAANYTIIPEYGTLTVTTAGMVIGGKPQPETPEDPLDEPDDSKTGVRNVLKCYDGKPTNIVVRVDVPGMDQVDIHYTTNRADAASWATSEEFLNASSNKVYYAVDDRAHNYASVTNCAYVTITQRWVYVSFPKVTKSYDSTDLYTNEFSSVEAILYGVDDNMVEGERFRFMAYGHFESPNVGSDNRFVVTRLVVDGDSDPGDYNLTLLCNYVIVDSDSGKILFNSSEQTTHGELDEAALEALGFTIDGEIAPVTIDGDPNDPDAATHSVVVDDKTMTYGGDLPELTYRGGDKGLVPGQVLKVELGWAVDPRTLTPRTEPYQDEIIVTRMWIEDEDGNVLEGAIDNYDIRVVPGSLTVNENDAQFTATLNWVYCHGTGSYFAQIAVKNVNSTDTFECENLNLRFCLADRSGKDENGKDCLLVGLWDTKGTHGAGNASLALTESLDGVQYRSFPLTSATISSGADWHVGDSKTFGPTELRTSGVVAENERLSGPELYVFARVNPKDFAKVQEDDLVGLLVWDSAGSTRKIELRVGNIAEFAKAGMLLAAPPDSADIASANDANATGVEESAVEEPVVTPTKPERTIGALTALGKTEVKTLALKGNYNGVVLGDGLTLIADATWKIAANGKWSGTVVSGATKVKVSGIVQSDPDGTIVLDTTKGPTMRVVRYAGEMVWTGTYGNDTLYGKATPKKVDPSWVGTWTSGLSGDGVGGYLSVKVSANGKGKVTGKLSGKTSISGSSVLLALDEAFLKENLPELAGHGGVAFLHIAKKVGGSVFDGGLVLGADKAVGGGFVFGGSSLAVVGGSAWDAKQSLLPLDGATLTAGAVSQAVVAPTDKKITVDKNDLKLKLSVKQSSGVFKGSFKNAAGVNCKFEGVLYVNGDGLIVGFGGGLAGRSETFIVEIK